MRAQSISRAVIATDDERIMEAARAFGAEVVMTSASHLNGTCRIEEAVRLLGISDGIVVNVQGDEPTIEPSLIDAAVQALAGDHGAAVSTVASPLAVGEDACSPHIVKVVLDQQQRALYFSRSLIPFNRDGAAAAGAAPLKHVGLYAYRREFLAEYVRLQPSPLELSECLEQLRIIEHGYKIAVAVRTCDHCGIDTPEQYEAFVNAWHAGRIEH